MTEKKRTGRLKENEEKQIGSSIIRNGRRYFYIDAYEIIFEKEQDLHHSVSCTDTHYDSNAFTGRKYTGYLFPVAYQQ